MTEIPGRNRTGHGGNIHAVQDQVGEQFGRIIDFSANINPLGPPEWLRPMVSRELDSVLHYPDPDYSSLVQRIAELYSVSPRTIIPANGSTELLYVLPRVLNCKRAVIPVPSYIDYARAARMAGLKIEFFYLLAENSFQLDLSELAKEIKKGDLVIFATPNNPTGATVKREDILNLAKDFPETIFLIDEAFLDFIEGGRSIGAATDNLLTLNSMTKFFGVPGLRLGFGIFPENIAQQVQDSMPPWTINSIAQKFGEECCLDLEYQKESRRVTTALREQLIEKLGAFDELLVYPAHANYLFIRLTGEMRVGELAEKMLKQGILIRCCDNYEGLDDSYFRVAVRTEEENEKLLAAFSAAFEVTVEKTQIARRGQKRTPAIMFQGTSSNAGKSVLTAAMCRILLQDGIRVAPFKAQNMSLNSFVTVNGEEMGRAQVVQAQAALLDPDVRMNPILLKPNSDTGSQIIVKGKPVGNMSVRDYSRYKPEAWEAARSSYDSLASEYEAIVLEGAGSPGEVNLKAEDIVNMKMAQYAKAPVLLVGDIDRGGVYASFVGTLEVLAPWERDLIGGFVVNRFRGDGSLLDSAHRYVTEHTGKQVMGVVPYLADLGIPEEDSVSFKSGIFNRTSGEKESVDIVLLNLPHISNFTDVEPFLEEPDVTLRIIDSVDDLGDPDAVILPGSKNVIGDLQFLLDKEFHHVLKKKAETGCEIVGICGGYQILGKTIDDPLGIESANRLVEGVGLLDITTEMKAEKRLTRQTGIHLQSGHEVFGYEIHHGISESDMEPAVKFTNGTYCGSSSGKMNVWGTYLHGIFDSDDFRRWFIDGLREKKGYSRAGRVLAPYNLEAAFDRLADNVRRNLDMDAVYKQLGL